MTTTEHNRSSSFEVPISIGRLPSTADKARAEGSSLPETIELPLEKRSELLGKSLARSIQIPSNVLQFTTEPFRTQTGSGSHSTTSRLIIELVSTTNESGSAESAFESYSQRLANSLRALLTMTQQWMEPTREACFAKLLMPVYLSAASQGSPNVDHMREAQKSTSMLLREICAMIEMDRALAHHGFTEWLLQSQRRELDPRLTIAQSFRVSIPHVANSLVATALTKSQERNSPITLLIDEAGYENKQRGWWSLATQWCRGNAALSLPQGMSIGIVRWEKLREHWSRLYHALQIEEAVTTAKKNKSNQSLIDGLNNNDDESTDRNCDPGSHCDLDDDVVNRLWIESMQQSSIPSRIIEIRAVNDPQLGNNLDQQLQSCRSEQGTLALLVLRHVASVSEQESNSYGLIRHWQSQFIECMDEVLESNSVRGFVTEVGELALVFEDSDRNHLAQCVRDTFAVLNKSMNSTQSLAANRPVPLIAGIAAVSSPSRSFRIDQLIDAAWRCLEGAAAQGAGAVKSLEVY